MTLFTLIVSTVSKLLGGRLNYPCMDYPPHDRQVHPTLYPSKSAALESKEAAETIEWEEILRHLTLAR